MTIKIDYPKQIKIVEEWAESRGYLVVYVPGLYHERGMFLSDRKEIQLYDGLRPEERLYVLLHEMGHAQIMSNMKWYRENFPAAASVSMYATSKIQKIGVLEEEYWAWQRATKLAKKLKLELNMEKFQRYKTKCIAGHIDAMFKCEKL